MHSAWRKGSRRSGDVAEPRGYGGFTGPKPTQPRGFTKEAGQTLAGRKAVCHHHLVWTARCSGHRPSQGGHQKSEVSEIRKGERHVYEAPAFVVAATAPVAARAAAAARAARRFPERSLTSTSQPPGRGVSAASGRESTDVPCDPCRPFGRAAPDPDFSATDVRLPPSPFHQKGRPSCPLTPSTYRE